MITPFATACETEITKSYSFKSNCSIDNHNLQLSLYFMHLIIFVSNINVNHENLINLG